MNKIKFGILGLGNISHRFVKGLQFVDDAQILAVCNRSLQKAKEYASEYQIPYHYDSYEEMLANSEIDAIYIATPNDTHAMFMMQALQHHKHVLCEKPFTIHSEDAKEVFAYAKQQQLVVMEAMKACFLPTTRKVKDWIKEGAIGKVLYIEAGYASKTEGVPCTHHLYDKQRGGGSFYDIGIYPLAYVNEIHPANITNYVSQSVWEHGVDNFTQVLIHYNDGVLASIRSSISLDLQNEAVIYGDKGTIRVPQFWKSERAYLETANEQIVFEDLHNKTEFRYQIQHFVQLLQTHQIESNIMSEEATIKNMELLEGVIFK